MFSVLSCNSELFESDDWRPMLIFPRWARSEWDGNGDAQWCQDAQWTGIGRGDWSMWTTDDWNRIPNRAFYGYL